eukprot:7204895-Pyramimonas_sp.AAC.1
MVGSAEVCVSSHGMDAKYVGHASFALSRGFCFPAISPLAGDGGASRGLLLFGRYRSCDGGSGRERNGRARSLVKCKLH